MTLKFPAAITHTTPVRSLISNSVWAFAAQVLSKLAVLIVMVIAARSLSLDQFGSFAVVQSAVLLAVACWDFGFSTYTTIQVSSNEMDAPTSVSLILSGRLVTLPFALLVLF